MVIRKVGFKVRLARLPLLSVRISPSENRTCNLSVASHESYYWHSIDSYDPPEAYFFVYKLKLSGLLKSNSAQKVQKCTPKSVDFIRR